MRAMDPVEALPSAAALGLESLVHVESTVSTMDDVHAHARHGAPGGLLVVADRQVAGRGRGGNGWRSEAGAGLWMTLLERPSDADGVRVLSLRLGLVVAAALQRFVDGTVRVKWPNDVYLVAGLSNDVAPPPARKLAGILVEARWREGHVDWVAIGIGINFRVSHPSSASLRQGTSRADVLRALVPALRDTALGTGELTPRELDAWHAVDLSVGRRVIAPVPGVVDGVTADGSLRVRAPNGDVSGTQVGSIRYEPDDSPIGSAP